MSSWKESALKRKEARQSKPCDVRPRHKKKRVKKHYVVEYKACNLWFSMVWHTWGRYKTEASRDTALSNLSKKYIGIFKFRAKQEER